MKTAVILSVLVGIAGPASAGELVNMFSLEGTCTDLNLGGDDLTPACNPRIMQMVYDDGRAGLYAFADGRIFAFSGTSDELIDDKLHQDLDKVVLGGSADAITEFAVTGNCVFENPFVGRAEISCRAEGADRQVFTLAFTTDGSAPVDELAD